jgi:hypothetical protein
VFRFLDLGYAILVLLPLVLAYRFAMGPISRARLEAFARHHRLVLTPANGNQVIRYLAVTRRWRCTGVGLCISFGVAWGLTGGSAGVNFSVAFAGWFVGALAAELHLAAVHHGPRRVASLRTRRPADYVSGPVWWLLPASAVSIATVLAAARGLTVVGWILIACAAAVLALSIVVRHRVLLRAQPAADELTVRADDAIRSRSMHVLSGGGFALVCFCAIAAAGTVVPAPQLGIAWLAVLIVGALAANARTACRPSAAPGAASA